MKKRTTALATVGIALAATTGSLVAHSMDAISAADPTPGSAQRLLLQQRRTVPGGSVAARRYLTDVSSVFGVDDAIVPLAPPYEATSRRLWKVFSSCVDAHGGVSQAVGADTGTPPPTPGSVVACAAEQRAAKAFMRTRGYVAANRTAEAEARLVWADLKTARITFKADANRLYVSTDTPTTAAGFAATLASLRHHAATVVLARD